MQSTSKTVQDYLKEIPADRVEAFNTLREIILDNLPEGFSEEMSYGMLGYLVPHSLYPAGYHCDPKLPLPFVGLASQKNFIAFYHMGLYASPGLLDWFVSEYSAQTKSKLDMGKSCTRFKKMEEIPYKLIGELMQKISVQNWIDLYEKNIKRKG